MLKISTEIDSAAAHIGEAKAVEYVAKAGFDAWDFSMGCLWRKDPITNQWRVPDHPLAGNEYLKFARQLKNIGLDNGIHCNQSHAPFPSANPTAHSFLKRAIECTAEAGGDICIVHPGNKQTAEQNAELYFELLPFAKECGVKLAAENMFNRIPETRQIIPAACSSPEDFVKHLELVNDPFLVACLDIGHAEIVGCETSAPEMIRALGSRLQALHIHDNNKLDDCHQLPFTMDIDFEAAICALKEIGYQGYLTLEANCYLKNYTVHTVFEGLQNMAATAKRLAQMYEDTCQ